MTGTVARLRRGSKHFEVLVDLKEAIKIRRGESTNISSALATNSIFLNSKSGEKPSQEDLQTAFNTVNLQEVALVIIKKGEIEIPKEYRDEEREAKKKKAIEWYIKNAVDSRTNRPFTREIISSAMDQAGINFEKGDVESQIVSITERLRKILPLKIETKRIAITIPAVHTGKAYGVINEYKEKEDWLSNGDLKVVVRLPLGLQSEFYDKLNSITHGSALTQEIKE